MEDGLKLSSDQGSACEISGQYSKPLRQEDISICKTSSNTKEESALCSTENHLGTHKLNQSTTSQTETKHLTFGSSSYQWISVEGALSLLATVAALLSVSTWTHTHNTLGTSTHMQMMLDQSAMEAFSQQVLQMIPFPIYAISLIYLTNRRRHYHHKGDLMLVVAALACSFCVEMRARDQFISSLLVEFLPISFLLCEVVSLLLGRWLVPAE